ncbi:MAG: ABC transporter ATP-binding protein [Betaproteobacteria bacterium]|nr:ABC transporter ATP-binding protein [Betaproteobacteria bacterium]
MSSARLTPTTAPSPSPAPAPAAAPAPALLEVRGLRVELGRPGERLLVVDDVDLLLRPGRVLGLVGESGSGKSVTALALMDLLEPDASVRAELLRFDGHDLLGRSAAQRRRLNGRDMAMVFQDPMGSLNPSYTIGWQLDEMLRLHRRGTRRERRQLAEELLAQVGIAAPAQRLRAYPHQLSGGMSQRVMIAMAVACRPRLLIADEPTTALDVTVQAQILELLLDLQRQRGMALLLISHDLGLVASAADEVAVMYAGRVVERAPAARIFRQPRHPYTAALLEALPECARAGTPLRALPGVMPAPGRHPGGCALHPRCRQAREPCSRAEPALQGAADGALARCFFPLHGPASQPMDPRA